MSLKTEKIYIFVFQLLRFFLLFDSVLYSKFSVPKRNPFFPVDFGLIDINGWYVLSRRFYDFGSRMISY